jgi:hypothetical protein
MNVSRTDIERQIRELLTTETRATVLSNKLFRPDGLFARLAGTPEERRELTKTPLFREAQDRLSDLQRAEMIAFRQAVAQVSDQLPDGLVSYKSEELPAA